MLKTLVITGASQGLGEAVALAYAAKGVRLGLIGRNAARLNTVAKQCRAQGAVVDCGVLDVRDRETMREWLVAFDAQSPVDAIIANAGIAVGTSLEGMPESTDDVYRLFDINLYGALNSIWPLLPAMRNRRSGHIVFISSLQAFTPLPDAPAYSASKAALYSYALAMRESVAADGVKVCVVCPGFVASAMSNAYQGRKLFEMSAHDAARRIQKGIARNTPVIAFPKILAFLARQQQALPYWLQRLALRGFRFRIAPRNDE